MRQLLLTLLFFAPIFSFADQKKVLIYFTGMGEYQWAKRLEKAFQAKDYTAKVHVSKPRDVDPNLAATFKIEDYDLDALEKKFHPDIILELNPSEATIDHPNRWIFFHTPQGIDHFLFRPAKLNYRGLILPFASSRYIDLQSRYKIIEGYPSHHSTPFTSLSYKKIFFCGFMWDRKRQSDDIKQLLTSLSKKEILSVYGPRDKWKFIDKSYKGYLPFEADSILKATQACGITLILHSDQHFYGKIPTARIFEAAAASSVIISDEHPFITKHFGNAVLYIDRKLSGKELAESILNHFEWIKKNRSRAEKMARKAHEIFIKNFALENIVQEIIDASN